MAYQVWAFVAGGAKAAYLENAFNVERTEKANSAPTLSFSLPADDAKAAYLTKAYEVKIYNTIKDRFEGIYILDDSTDKWSSSGSTIECNYSGVISQLVGEDNISYDTTSTPKTPTQIVTALLALQTNTTTPITVGTIQPTTSFAIAVENTNILKALLEAVSYLGGRIEVDDSRALNWYTDLSTTTPTREIRYQKNMIGVTRKRDYTSLTNRLYAYGYGETEAQLTLIDAGEAHEYIEDATSQAAYGIQIKRITDKRIIHPTTLLLWAQKVLAEYKDPIFSYQVDVANLAVHPDFTFDLEDLEVGQIVRVVNSDLIDPLTGLGLNVNVKIVSVTTDLSTPHSITVELANATKSLADSIAASADTSSVVNNIAVQIGAGQVTVLGTFTVDGWRTAGQTTIDGGNITANTISVAKLTVTPVLVGGAAADVNAGATTISGGKITTNTLDADAIKTSTLNAKTITLGTTGGDAIIKSGNYSAGSAGWQIKANGDAEFNNVTVRGTIATATISSGEILTVSGSMKSSNFVLGSAGWELDGSGSCWFNTISCNDSISCGGTVGADQCFLGKVLELSRNTTDGDANIRTLYTNNGTNLLWKSANGTIRTILP
ncbi:phage tail spike protein [Methanoregula sp.]|jgi:phage minor structural protein|uniref:phage tail spike protein n=1 Tax=Methanoregula sp. TaxID=2052170 RepID=UPI003568E80A